MRDHVTEELISAYVDGELEGDELKLAEDLLAESAEHRQLLAEFRAMRASMWSLPSYDLPSDFHTRVVDQIDELKVSPSKESSQRDGRGAAAVPWGSVLLATASLAAVVTLTVMLRPVPTTPDVPGQRGTSGNTQVMPVYLQKAPSLVMVYDVTVTPAGQKSKAIESLLKKRGIDVDPALRLDEALEKELMVIREADLSPNGTKAVPYKSDRATPKSTDKDKVDMIYVAGTFGTLSDVGQDLERMRDVGIDASRCYFAFVYEPNKIGVMNRLHESAREHFAHRTNIVPSDAGQAFRLVFHLELTNASVPGAATFPLPTIRPESKLLGPSRDAAPLEVDADGAKTSSDAPEVKRQLNQSSDEGDGNSSDTSGPRGPANPADGRKHPGHILLIIRNASANADNAN